MSNAGHVRNADAIECNSEETVSPPVSPVASVRGELWTPCSSFQLGDTIEANWRLSGKYYMGVVTATNDDETFAIQYVDGDSENRVAAKSIRAVHARRRGATAAAAGAPGQRKEVICASSWSEPAMFSLQRLLFAGGQQPRQVESATRKAAQGYVYCKL